MLPNTPQGGLQARHNRQHRRQNSTPTAFEGLRIDTNLQNMHQHAPPPQQQHMGRPRVSHRRGMSLDTRQQHMQQMPSPDFRPDFQFPMVSEHTNTAGLSSTPQHVLRETQPQRLASPGSQQQQQQQQFAHMTSGENYIMTPTRTPHTNRYSMSCFEDFAGSRNMGNMQFELYGPGTPQMEMMMKRGQESFGENNMGGVPQDFSPFPSSSLSTPTFMNFQEGSVDMAAGWVSEAEVSSSRRNSRRVSNGIMDRVSKFETLGTDQGSSRPVAPPQQNANGYFPPIPNDRPHHNSTSTLRHKVPQRFSDDYDESMEETIKPNRSPNRRPRSSVFDEMRQEVETHSMQPSPSRASSRPLSGLFEPPQLPPPQMDPFMEMNMGNMGMPIQTHSEGLPVQQRRPMSAVSNLSQHTTPITPHMGDFGGMFDQRPDLSSPNLKHEFSEDRSASSQRPSRRNSPHHRRTDSVASIASAASIASIDIEKTRTDTGVTLDAIHEYIEGPDPRDNKWICTFEGCLKRFGRKENIKSHVQTHLNDRQYECPTCLKCFVRQHDLKRHAKIHTGIKPYPCMCGNSFARHDALTRHRLRGMCKGAYEGVQRKMAKRGRPRKDRTDTEARAEKKVATRKKIKSTSSCSSQSGYSDSSAANSPDNAANDLDMLADLDVSLNGTTLNPGSLQGMHGSSSAEITTMSGQEPSSANVMVHSYISHQMSHMSLAADGSQLSLPPSPARSVHSQYNEPPELSQSSSPPAYFGPGSSSSDMLFSASGDANEDDILLQFTHSAGPDNMLLPSSDDSKFDDEYSGTVGMFSNNDDVFFGSGV